MHNRAERRRNGIRAITDARPAQHGNGTATPQPSLPQLFGLVMAGRAEQVAQDGTKLAVIVFHVMTTEGSLLVEEAPGGQVPITIVSQPIAVGRSLVLPGMPAARA
jgi:hypothetical protein